MKGLCLHSRLLLAAIFLDLILRSRADIRLWALFAVAEEDPEELLEEELLGELHLEEVSPVFSDGIDSLASPSLALDSSS